ncbi:MAG: type III restriction endonuclease subunit R [Candidatus Raymondbacteria bacterium RifOxyA12_full_50_37]|nr:MAG: type III restriction endonuclease subunit R [Candidatus Raymondbacteria bacterium RifOxyA12_full_50_37]OGJ92411.1 MAG: type III restriction endonuclease subunit R [Candidatus Raymondbacteria bacterium RifOxyB12_full_50_8]OGJ93811.1 MAG: type III restriction endonuclease subunit R [Candidatus Raymondbacteria bacterium RIFOXYA2_FULL_49_16]OGJ94305.1 MAG: type III restriction endonuclease subunit R [Candidatus Raymondbacteria bacterium RifOxyC12_full_50_8]OGJ98322.1 MAG: type III restricti
MNPHCNAIANRLSLRAPQRESLDILSRICELLPLTKGADAVQALETIKAEFSTVTDFERDFPSLCFALATGVGKTRLMGAFISYLYRAKNIKHFFVLAPNLTIYNKLIADFTPNTPKYVFQGISEFAVEPPDIITGDNYESGRGIRKTDLFGVDERVHINIFNISKITSLETPQGAIRTNVPRFRRLQEYIGESYFEYLSKLEDLVLLMDESHRYRASAGMKAISELKPIIGLELTATPQTERATGPVPFKNVIFSYPLSAAMTDGFVKEPAVATRENFNAKNYDEPGLERLKLEDGIRIHENTKVELEVYARQNDRPIVKPFVLVVAKDTDHANTLLKVIEDEDFFEGRYKGKVITVHSNQRGEERDETVQQLISVENPDNPTEIVIHVNMLKEGWDVTNLYTIVPLRTANSQTLVEQSIGRGLRLPYGKRTGVGAVDRLTIVSHDRFQEIVDYANSPNSIIRGGLKVVYINDERTKPVIVDPEIINRISQTQSDNTPGGQQNLLFDSPKEREAAKATLEVIRREFERLPKSADLARPDIQEQIVARVREMVAPVQLELTPVTQEVNIAEVVAKTITLRNELSIDIPRITIQPVGDVSRGFRDFSLNLSGVHLQPVDNEILIQELQKQKQYRLLSGDGVAKENRPEDYLVRGLIDYDDISYDQHAALLYKLSGQMVAHLYTYLKNEADVLNVLQYHQQALVNLIHSQMQEHYVETATSYEAHVSKGFVTLRPNNYTAPADESERDYHTPVTDLYNIRKMLFAGFKKCLYRIQKFDSDTERRFSVILENDPAVSKWFKPARGDFQIYYLGDSAYEPDFVVETATGKYLCETKKAQDIDDSKEVAMKAEAARNWCVYASEHEKKHGGKPWTYLLVPHSIVTDNMTISGLARFSQT